MMSQIFAQMIGVPFIEKGRDLSGWDCWGCVAWGLKQGFGVEVPSYHEHYATTKDGEEITALINRESLGWQPVECSQAQPGDVLILRIKGRPWHAALVVEPPWFIHADRDVGTVRERWDGIAWTQRLIGLYRHPELVNRAGVRAA